MGVVWEIVGSEWGISWVHWLSDIGFSPKNAQKRVEFYGMELPRVGAFTENGGIRYRNPVQILGVLAKNHGKLEFWGLV